ncbi:MAG: hypothetical protein QHH44_05675, partial [Candidatus Saccharicenans sp.]|nr:hypothetical protein [Candidatus Saccharicenans sp.]
FRLRHGIQDKGSIWRRRGRSPTVVAGLQGIERYEDYAPKVRIPSVSALVWPTSPSPRLANARQTAIIKT